MQHLEKGRPLTLSSEIALKRHHTISKCISKGGAHLLILFSLAEHTDIGEEYYDNLSLNLVLKGGVEIQNHRIAEGEFYVSEAHKARGVKADEDSIFLELVLEGEENYMKNIDQGKVVELKNAIEYVEGGISNLDIASGKGVKFMLMAFDKGQGLTPHIAPGDAMVIALDGSAYLQVGEEIHRIQAGEQLIFPKNIKHNVTAKDERFKMALLLIRDEEA